MARLTSQQLESIRFERFYTDVVPGLPGFERFVSADPRFPISIAYPAHLTPWYNREDPSRLRLESSGERLLFFVEREDLQKLAQDGDQRAAAVLNGRDTLTAYQKEVMSRKAYKPRRDDVGRRWSAVRKFWLERHGVGVGEPQGGNFPVMGARLSFENWDGDCGEWVFFGGSGNPRDSFTTTGNQPALWTIARNPDDELERRFPQVLRSFCWLSREFIGSLRASM
jgi:hypothetical protein